MVIILAPTRELSQQIYAEVKKFARNYSKIRAGICFGGGNMYDQGKELKRGCEILVATPGNFFERFLTPSDFQDFLTFCLLDLTVNVTEVTFL